MVLPKIKLHQLFFYLLILFLPTQLGKHFWPDWNMVLGLRLDYLSPTFYFTDILILGILISWIAEKFTIFRHSGKRSAGWRRAHPESDSGQARMTRGKVFLFLSFFIFLLINCFFAQNQPAAFYKLIKILELSFLGFYVAKNSHLILNAKYLILIPMAYSSLIAIAQFINQRSMGGIFYWLGERNFTAGTPGIAQTIWDGRLLLRPYATFSHPNVLAGFLVISLLLILIKNRQTNTTVVICPLVLGVIALFLTFSRVAWVVFGLLAVPFLLRAFKPSRIFLITGSICLIGLISLIWIPIQDQSITYRQDLNLAAVKIWESSPLVGVGLNNFLVRLPEFYQSNGEIRWFQPAHNIFLMVLAETGLIGLIGLIWFLVLTYKRLLDCSIVKLLIPLTTILVLGLFDHYFYTLQQGQLLVALVFGLAWSNSLQNGKISG